jgi:Trk K+ transport system NAD-binding subunit
MRAIPRAIRRLVYLILSLPVLLFVLALVYQAGMKHLERHPRSLGEALQWAAATLTTTGYGRDAIWAHPLMEVFVIFVQFAGVMLIFLVVPVVLIPFLEERFEARLPTTLPNLSGHVLIYRYGRAVSSLVEQLEQAGIPIVIFEEDEPTARRLFEREHAVVLGNLEEDDPDLSNLVGARGLVLNGSDDDNAAMILSARYQGYQGPIVALVRNPQRRPLILRAGATNAFTADHVLAAALAARASGKINPRLSGVHHLGRHLEVAELRVQASSPIAGSTISEAGVRAKTGATIVGLWAGGALIRQPDMSTTIRPGQIIVAVGSRDAIRKLGELATPVRREGRFLVLGHDNTGRKVAEFLRDAGESVTTVDAEDGDKVDIVGDPLSPDVLSRAGLESAQAVILSFASDSATLFAAAVVRNLAPDVIIIASTSRQENVGRIHRAGADFALAVGQVAGQLLAFHLLGQHSVSLEAEIKLVASAPGSLAGRPLSTKAIRERTGCSVVAVERGDDVIVSFGESFSLQPNDIVYLTGTHETLGAFYRAYPGTGPTGIARQRSWLADGVEDPTPTDSAGA